MTLRLSPEDQAEYIRRCAINQALKEAYMAVGDAQGARRARQAQSALYHEFERKQLPKSYTPRLMTVGERLEQIEEKLGITNVYI